MTTDERLAKQKAAAKIRIQLKQCRLAHREAKAAKALERRRYLVGAMAHEAGLFAWSNADLGMLFAAIADAGELRSPITKLDVSATDMAASVREKVDTYVAQMPISRSLEIEVNVVAAQSDALSPPGGIVYVLQMEGHPWLKIGYVMGGIENVRVRIAQLQIGCPQPLILRQAYACELPERLENRVHYLLAEFRRTGEWFDTDVETIDTTVRSLWGSS